MFMSGMNPTLGSTFMVSTAAHRGASRIKVFNWMGTMWRGNLRSTSDAQTRSLCVDVHDRRLSGIFMAATPWTFLSRHAVHRGPSPTNVLFGGSLFALFCRDPVLVSKDVRPDDERADRQACISF